MNVNAQIILQNRGNSLFKNSTGKKWILIDSKQENHFARMYTSDYTTWKCKTNRAKYSKIFMEYNLE